MASTGQSGSNQSLVGSQRLATTGNSFVPGNALASPALRRRQADVALMQAATDHVGLGGDVVASASTLAGMATAPLRRLVPAILDQVAALSAAARRLLPGQSTVRDAQTGTASPGAFAQRVVSVTGGAGVTAAASAGARVASYRFTVTQVAAGQTSTSDGFVSSNPNVSPITSAGSLTITIGSTTTTVAPTFSAATTSNQALQAVATAVNAAGIDVTAQVVTAHGGSALAITRKTTGASGTFTVGGTLATPLGFTTTTAARDAQFSVDGATMTSSTNAIQLDQASSGASAGRVQAYLTGPTASAVTISVGVGRNDQVIVDAVKVFIENFNVFRQTVADMTSVTSMAGILTAGTKNQLDGALDGLRETLHPVGIGVGSGGVLRLDEGALRASLKATPAKVESAIGGPSGLASRVFGVTRAIEKSPGILFAHVLGAGAMPTGSSLAQANRLDLAMTKRLLDLQA